MATGWDMGYKDVDAKIKGNTGDPLLSAKGGKNVTIADIAQVYATDPKWAEGLSTYYNKITGNKVTTTTDVSTLDRDAFQLALYSQEGFLKGITKEVYDKVKSEVQPATTISSNKPSDLSTGMSTNPYKKTETTLTQDAIDSLKDAGKFVSGILKGFFVDYPINLVKDIQMEYNAGKTLISTKSLSAAKEVIDKRLQERGIDVVKTFNQFYSNPLTEKEVEKYANAKPIGFVSGLLDWTFLLGLAKNVAKPTLKQVPLTSKTGMEISVTPEGEAQMVVKTRSIQELTFRPNPNDYLQITGKTSKPSEPVIKFYKWGEKENSILKVTATPDKISVQGFNIEPSALEKAVNKIFGIKSEQITQKPITVSGEILPEVPKMIEKPVVSPVKPTTPPIIPVSAITTPIEPLFVSKPIETKTVTPVAKETTAISPDLAQEARKYKSAEEFVKAHENEGIPGEKYEDVRIFQELKNILPKFKNSDEFSNLYEIASRNGKVSSYEMKSKRTKDLVNELVDKDIAGIDFRKLGKMTGRKFKDEFGKDFFEQVIQGVKPQGIKTAQNILTVLKEVKANPTKVNKLKFRNIIAEESSNIKKYLPEVSDKFGKGSVGAAEVNPQEYIDILEKHIEGLEKEIKKSKTVEKPKITKKQNSYISIFKKDYPEIYAKTIKEVLGKETHAGITMEEAAKLKTALQKNTPVKTVKEAKAEIVEKVSEYTSRKKDPEFMKKLLDSTHPIYPKTTGKKTQFDIWKEGIKEAYIDTLHAFRVADEIDGLKSYTGENAKMVKNLGAKETTAKINKDVKLIAFTKELQNIGVKELTQKQLTDLIINIRYKEGAFDQVKTLMENAGIKEIPKLTEQEEKIIEIIKKYATQNKELIKSTFEGTTGKKFEEEPNYILPLKY